MNENVFLWIHIYTFVCQAMCKHPMDTEIPHILPRVPCCLHRSPTFSLYCDMDPCTMHSDRRAMYCDMGAMHSDIGAMNCEEWAMYCGMGAMYYEKSSTWGHIL